VAATKLQWVLSLDDRMSAPASKAARALAKLEAQNERMRRASAATARGFRGAQLAELRQARASERMRERVDRARRAEGAASAVDRGEAFGAVGMALGTIVSVAAAAAAAVGRVGAAFASAAHDAIVFRERSINTLRTVLQSDEAAQRVFSDSQRIARLTPFETNDVVEQRVRLIAADFSEEQSRTLQAALADVQALFGQSRAEILTSAFERIQNGGLSGEVLEELRNSRLGTQQVLESLARSANITYRNPQELQQRVLQAARQGRIQNSAVIASILDQVQRRTHTDTLGAFARQRGGESFEGALSNLRSAFGDLLTSGSIGELAGVRSLTRGMGRVSELLSDQTEIGRRLRTVLYEIIGAAGGFVGRLLEGGSAERFLERVVALAEDLWTRFRALAATGKVFVEGLSTGLAPLVAVMRQLGPATASAKPGEDTLASWRAFGEVLGGAITVVGGALGVLYTLGSTLVRVVYFPVRVAAEAIRSLSAAVEALTSGGSLRQVGWQLVEGFFQGVQEAFSSFAQPIQDLFGGVAAAARNALQIHSPSRVFEEIGAYTAEGFSIGLEGGDPARAMAQLMAPPQVTAAGIASSNVGPITITIDGAREPAEVAREVAASLAELFDLPAPEAP